MSEATQKGRTLEDAILSIERMILSNSPALATGAFKIETRKICVVDGVKHELDLWVEVDPAPGYGSTFVFECKNWSDRVGKNEIVIFSEKIKVVQAQRGYFVAHAFSRDARAQAALDPRLESLEAREDLVESLQVPLCFHVLAVDNQHVDLAFFQDGWGPGDKASPIDFGTSKAVLDGNAIDLKEFAGKWRDQTSQERTKSFPSQTLPAGVYPLEAESHRQFPPGHLVIDDRQMTAGFLKMQFTAEVIRPAIVSTLGVAGRGRVWHLEPVKLGGGELRSSLTTLGDDLLEMTSGPTER